MDNTTQKTLEQLQAELEAASSLMEKLRIKDEILELERSLGVKTQVAHNGFECVGCSG